MTPWPVCHQTHRQKRVGYQPWNWHMSSGQRQKSLWAPASAGSKYPYNTLYIYIYDIWHIYIYGYIYTVDTNIYIYIWSPPPGPIRALGAGVITLDNYIINMITCSKTLQIPVKNASYMHMTLNILTFQKEKTPISWNQNLVLKRVQLIFKLWTLCTKNAPDPSKSCMGSKTCHIHMRQEYLQAIETISK